MNRKQNLNSACLARCVRYISFYVSHNWKKNCQCYKCKLARILLSVIDTRGHFEIFHIIKTRNAKASIEKLSGHVLFFDWAKIDKFDASYWFQNKTTIVQSLILSLKM